MAVRDVGSLSAGLSGGWSYRSAYFVSSILDRRPGVVEEAKVTSGLLTGLCRHSRTNFFFSKKKYLVTERDLSTESREISPGELRESISRQKEDV